MAHSKHKSRFDFRFAFIEKRALQIYFQIFEQKEFMLHQARGLPPHPAWSAYHDEEKRFLKTVCEVAITKISISHVI